GRGAGARSRQREPALGVQALLRAVGGDPRHRGRARVHRRHGRVLPRPRRPKGRGALALPDGLGHLRRADDLPAGRPPARGDRVGQRAPRLRPPRGGASPVSLAGEPDAEADRQPLSLRPMQRLVPSLMLASVCGSLTGSCRGRGRGSGPAAVAAVSTTTQTMPVPVLELRYFPTTDGVTLDQKETTYGYSLPAIQARVQDLSGQLAAALEQGSVYVGDPSRSPSLD